MKDKIKHYFETHPEQTEVHSTADGFLFTEKHFAETHGNSLDHKEVETHFKSDLDALEAAESNLDNEDNLDESLTDQGGKEDKNEASQGPDSPLEAPILEGSEVGALVEEQKTNQSEPVQEATREDEKLEGNEPVLNAPQAPIENAAPVIAKPKRKR